MPSYAPEKELYGEIGESLEPSLFRILYSTAPFTGDEFLEAVTRKLAEVCGVRMTYVSELLLSVEKARVVAACRNNERLPPFEYALAGTPCAKVVEQGTTIFRDAVAQHFSLLEWLFDIEPEAYVATLLRSTSGDIIGVLAIVHDAPLANAELVASLLEALAPRVEAELERRQRDSVLRRSEARLRRVVEYCRDILFYYQVADRSFEFISPAVEEITGYPPEAFQANSDLALQIIYEEDRPRVRSAIDSGSEEPITARIRTLAGETRWIEYRNYAFSGEDGSITAVCGTIRDTTRRVKALEALQISEQYRSSLLGAMPDTLFRLDADGKMLDYVSGEATRALTNPSQDLNGRSLKELLPAVFVTPISQLTQAALQTHRLQRTEFEVSSESQTMTYEARCLPFGRAEVLLILRDFTAAKWHKGEEETRRFRDELDVKVESLLSNSYLLTYREIAILHLVAQGQTDKQIAESLGISTYTVNKHVGNILGKMNAASRTEAGVRALREGLVA